jgi:hypothetical protein
LTDIEVTNTSYSIEEQFEACRKYMVLAVEFEGLWIEASKNGFVNLKPLEDWRDKNWKEMERLRKIAFSDFKDEPHRKKRN